VLAGAYQARLLADFGNKTVFTPNDGSPEERLNLLYNRSKHVDSAIRNGQMPPEGTLAVWLTNDGLESTDGHLSFAELAAILTELAVLARIFEDPISLREKLQAMLES
jgi:hypothetical protein